MRKILSFFGIDRAVAYTLLGRVWNIFAGLITLIFVARFFSVEQQGFYYTFVSILAIQMIFELGLSYVIVQYASHEKAKLSWDKRGILEGNPDSKAKLYSLFRFSLFWYGAMAIVFLLVLLPAGILFFSKYAGQGSLVAWRAEWCWFAFFSTLNLLVIPVVAILEGCGLVADVALMRLGQYIFSSLLAWLAFYLGMGLFVLTVLNASRFIWGAIWLLGKRWFFLKDFISAPYIAGIINWKNEIWPFQWKIALTWISGYFIYQLFNPVLFAYHGAVVAGQMGMSLTIASALSTTALAWISTKTPFWGMMVANRDFNKLDKAFFISLRHSLVFIIISGALIWISALYLHAVVHPLSSRIIGPLPFGLLILATIINHVSFSEALYLRAHKKEPFFIIFVINACLIGLAAFVLGKPYGVMGMVGGYFLSSLGLFFAANVIFSKKRKEWHF